jgi:multiple sugar transport system ATP-binding protein
VQALKIIDVHKGFGATQVLRGIDLAVEAGEFLILVGPSGCGKSTLLNQIAGLDSTSSGRILIGERDVTDLPPKDRDIAMVFQSYALYPTMTVRQNIAFGLEIRRVPKAQREAAIARVADMLQIGALLDRKPAELSGGQRQRVAMGRALAREPALFLFDEPLSNLDAKLRVEMRAEIKALHLRTGTTIVYVTHDQVEAMTLGDRIAVMKDGLIQQFGTPREVYEDPANQFVAGFIGSPSMNFIPCPVTPGPLLGLTGAGAAMELAPGTSVAGLGAYAGREVLLGIRPEQMTAAPTQPEVSGQIREARLECRVDLVEPTGPDTFVHTRINGTRAIGRIHPSVPAHPGAVLGLDLDLRGAVFFDPPTGERIR